MLSLNKLENFLAQKGFFIKKIFTISEMCVYLEVICINNADIFLLYIPSKYDIKVDGRNDVYKISYIEINTEEIDTVVKDHVEGMDNLDLEMLYDEVNLDHRHSEDLAEHMEENYKRSITLKEIAKNDSSDLKDIFRQLNRLKFCTLNIKYKLSIQFKYYMICVRRDDSLDCFYIKNYPILKPQRRLMVIVDLETLYDSIDSVELDIKTIQNSIYKILDKNQLSHSVALKEMLEEKNDIEGFSSAIYQKKIQCTDYIIRLEAMLATLCNSEKKLLDKMMETEEKYNLIGIKGIHTDIEKSHVLAKYETELDKMNLTKQEIIKNIIILKSKREDTFLFADKLFFDNSVMMDTIIKNMNKAKYYTK